MSDDLAQQYSSAVSGRASATDAAEMEGWLADFNKNGATVAAPVAPSHDYPVREHQLPAPPEQRKVTNDPLGRVDPKAESTAGTIMRNASEVVPQAVAGMHDAVVNATQFLNPLADWLNENVADLSYDPKGAFPAAKTGTGQVSRKISEFMTGFVPALKGLRAAGVGGNIAAPIAAGAISDFVVRDAHEGRLADMWNEAGLPANVLTDFLRSKPDDSEMEGRFKNALEGAGFGVTGTAVVEGVLHGARAIRAARAVKPAMKKEEEFLKAKYGELSDEQFNRIVGDPTKPMIETKVRYPSKAGEKIIGGLEAVIKPHELVSAAKPDSPETYVNFARFDAPDSVQSVIGKMANSFKGKIDEARRGTITQEETARMADELGMTVTDLIARRKGQTFNAEEALAARQLWSASGEKLLEAAKIAAGPNAGPLDQYAFRKMMAVHSAIQSEVIGARTETARALASWSIPAGGNIEKARAIDQIMGTMGGPEASKEMARRLAILADSGASPAMIAKFASRSRAAMTMDVAKEAWTNGLLSSPKTHVVNTVSNTLVVFQQIYERKAAEVLSFGSNGGVAAGEAAAMTYGAVESIKDAFRMAAKSLKTGETGYAFNKIDTARPRAISSEAMRMSSETGLGRFVDYVGNVANVPGRLLGAEDEFFKTIGYRMELRAQALRTASQEGHKGAELVKRTQELVDDAPEHIRINAADAAMYNTFTNEMGAFGKAVLAARNIDSPWNPLPFVIPFVRTPVNVARYAFERTPLAPLVSQWRADVAAGGARADLALARMATGSAIMLVAMDMADSGQISGPGPSDKDKDVKEALLRQGWQPYSIKVGDRWVSYNRLDPMGMTVGFASSITEAVRKGELDQNDVDEWQEVTAMAIAAVSQVAISKTYMEGISKLIEVMSDPKRYSEKYVDDLFASFLPATALSASVKSMVDPIQREAGTPAEAVMARIAGLSDKLPPRRSLWGEPLSSESGLGRVYDAVSPAQSKAMVSSPIDKEMTRLGDAPLRIGKKTPFDGVQANLKQWPHIYDEYTRLSGNELKHPAWGMGAKDYLSAVVSGKHPMSSVYNIMPDESKKAFIQNAVQDYRKLAQRQILNNPNNRDFATEINSIKQAQQAAKMPILGGAQ